jgi:hypothetical protein
VATKPHTSQHYDTAGDYKEIPDAWVVSVSELSDWRHEALIMLHELVEMVLTKNNGLSWDDITRFDIESQHPDPGSLPEAPYHKEHKLAEKIEKMMAKELGVDWKEYNKELDSLEYK